MRYFLICCLLIALPSLLPSQTPTGEITGLVTDTTGAAIPGVSVEILNLNTGLLRSTNTGAVGFYTVALLPTGTYRVSVKSQGFRSVERSNLELAAMQSLRVDVQLEIGEVTETVTVTDEAPQVDTRTVNQGMLVDDRRVRDLPLNGRNVTDLTRLVPGLNRATTNFDANSNQQRIYLNGTRDSSMSFLVDGSPVHYSHRGRGISLPPPDAVQEFKISSAGVPAEYGRGAAVMSTVTRSGTNEYHGSLWEFLRNDAFDARNFFASTTPKLRFNQFGGTVGGPIARNKSFFFGSYQSLRIRKDALSTSAFPPTDQERSGNFSASSTAVIDPSTKQPYANNIVPQSRIDPVAQRFLNDFVPSPNRPNGSFVQQASSPNDSDQFMGRIDRQLTQNNRLMGRYFYDFNRGTNPFSGSSFVGYNAESSQYRQQTLTLEDSQTIGAAMVQTARFTFNRFDYGELNTEEGDLTTFGASDFIHAGGPRNTRPTLEVAGRFNLGVGRDRQRLHDNWGVSDNLAVMTGNHQIKFGVDFERNRFQYTDNRHAGGTFDFNGSRTGIPFADFLQGLPRRFDQAAPFLTNQTYNYLGLYVQDAWRVAPRLTLNLGLRSETFGAWQEDNGQISAFVAGAQSDRFPTAPVGLAFQDDAEFPYKRNALNLAPRVGIAWDVFGTGRTAVRTSFGIHYDALTAEMAGGVSAPQPFGLTLRVNTPQSLSHPYGGRSNPFPFEVDPANATFVTPIQIDKSFDANVKNPYIMSWTLGIQQQLAANYLFDIAYVGNAGRKQILIRELNPAVYGPGATEGNTNQRRSLFPGYSSIGQLYSDGNASYHGLQVQLNKRFSSGLTFSANYTFAKSIDEAGIGNSFANVGQQSNQVPSNRKLDRGPSEIDLRQRFASSFLYEIPFAKGARGVVNRVLGDWEIGGLTSIQSGQPLTIFTGEDRSLTGVGNDRPNAIANPNLDTGRSRGELIAAYFNTAAFVPNEIGHFGNVGRGLVYGPGEFSLDLSLRKSIVIRERQSLQFRWEAFNAMNWVNLGKPVTTLVNTGFGRITSAGDARIMQLSLKYNF